MRKPAINYASLLRPLAGLAVLLVVVITTMTAVRMWPRPSMAERIPSSSAVFDHKGRLLRLTLASDQQYRLWTSLDEVSPELVEALLLHEDQHFYRHLGINPAALIRAGASSYSGGPRVGGSTITMQLARLLYGLN
ncbi:MAG: transglycosylase domain-containing protein, partial [Steroidobacteraceae bacterium]